MNSIGHSNKDESNMGTFADSKGAFSFLVSALAAQVERGQVVNLPEIRDKIVKGYLPLETSFLRESLRDTDYAGIRLVMRPTGKISMRLGNEHVTQETISALLGDKADEVLLRLDAIYHLYKTFQSLSHQKVF